MKNKKLFRLLRLLSADELHKFGEFLYSPYHNKSVKTRELWDLLKAYAPSFENEALRNYQTYATIYDKPASLEALVRSLGHLLEDFLALQGYREDQYYRKHLLLEELLRLKALKDFEQVHKRVLNHLEQDPLRGKDFYYRKYLIAYDYLEFLSQNHPNIDRLAEKLADTVAALDTSYLIPKLTLSIEMENLKRIVKSKVDLTSALLPEIDGLLSEGWQSESPGVGIQHLALRLVRQGDEADFVTLLDLMEQHQSEIPKSEAHLVYIIAINFCTKMVLENPDYYEPLFAIYQKTLRQEALTAGSSLTPLRLKNMVIAGCRLKKYEETRELLQELKGHIHPSYRKSLYHLCQGIIAFYQNEMEEATDQLLLAETREGEEKTVFGIDAQFLRLKCLYLVPPKDSSQFNDLLSAFRKRVAQSKLIRKERKEAYRNFCKILKPMYEMKADLHTKVTKAKLYRMLEGFSRVSDRAWVKKEVEKLEVSSSL